MSENPKAKRILIFSTAYFPFVGGAEVAVKEITDRLPDIEFDMITANISNNPHTEKVGNINVYRVGAENSFVNKYYLALRGHKFAQKLHAEKKYDAVWGIMASYGGFAASAFKKKNKNVPFLLTLQEGDPISFIKFRALPLWFAFKKIFKRADYIQAISNYLANWAKDMGATCPVEVVPNGVDITKFEIQSTKSETNNKLKIELNLKQEDKILITTSRLEKKNGVIDAIDALRYLPPNIKFIILGSGSLEANLKLKIKKLKLEDRVLMRGAINHARIPEYLSISDVFVRPSRSEGLGNSFLEAMAAGVPVIGTNVGGIPDFLINEETGLFCEVDNPKDLADKIKHLMDDRGLREKLVTNAKKLVQEKYDWGQISQEMKEIFTKLAAGL